MAEILIIDDDKIIHDWVTNAIKGLGHRLSYAYDLKSGLQKIKAEPFDIVFLDTQLPDGRGLDILPKIRTIRFSPEVIVLTAFGDPDEAEFAIKNGAWDYIEKPASLEAIRLPIIRALEYRAERTSIKPPVVLNRKGIIGSSPKLLACLELVSQAANSDINVLIEGETGTGKELFAKAIHLNSSRANMNFVVVDCTALPETLVESVLFGHARGAFTGADRSEDGLIKQADGGTLFLDEIGELPALIQKKFLRVLQEHRFRPVGGRREISSDFRLLAATNRDLGGLVQQGLYREDLVFRLRTLVMECPPLRELQDDTRELTLFYMNSLCNRFGLKPKGLSPEFWTVVTRYKWPGNVRELIHALEKALISAKDEPVLFPNHLPTYIRIHVARSSFHAKPAGPDEPKSILIPPILPLKLSQYRDAAVSEAEKIYLKDLLSFTGRNIDEACRISGLSRSRLYTLIRKYHPK